MATLRRASPADAVALAALRAVLHEEMGRPVGPADRAADEDAFRRRLTGEAGFAAFLVEQDEAVVACGVVHVEEHLPSPGRPDGRRAHVSSMVTHPGARRQGHARRVLQALLDWCDARGVPRVDLWATPAGQGLYASMGFRTRDNLAMTRAAAVRGHRGVADATPPGG